jgi:hypothetical protein
MISNATDLPAMPDIRKCKVEISLRLLELNKTLQLLKDRMKEELGKPFGKRDRRLLQFIHKESSVYEFAVAQLEWVLSLIKE